MWFTDPTKLLPNNQCLETLAIYTCKTEVHRSQLHYETHCLGNEFVADIELAKTCHAQVNRFYNVFEYRAQF